MVAGKLVLEKELISQIATPSLLSQPAKFKISTFALTLLWGNITLPLSDEYKTKEDLDKTQLFKGDIAFIGTPRKGICLYLTLAHIWATIHPHREIDKSTPSASTPAQEQ